MEEIKINIMERRLTDCRVIGFRRSNKGRSSDVYMIRECDICHAILEFPSNEVSSIVKNNIYQEYIKCPNCMNKIIVVGENYD